MPTKKTNTKKLTSPTKKTPKTSKPAAKVASQTLPPLADLNGHAIVIKNEGQKIIYLLRKAYLEGTLSTSSNPTTEIQFILNQPIEIKAKDYRPEPRDKKFLGELIKKVESGAIKLLTPSTLLNQEVYNQLPAEKKAKADYDILILLYKIRQVKKLWDEGAQDSYQIMNLVHSLRLAKERLETQQGDVFVI